jgi:hypothetical protein
MVRWFKAQRFVEGNGGLRVVRGKRRGSLPSAPITTAQNQSTVQEGAEGGRYFIYRPPPTVDGVPSTPGVRPGRPATPSKSPPPVFLVADVFQLPRIPDRRFGPQLPPPYRQGGRRRRAQFDGVLLWPLGVCTRGRAFDRRAAGVAAGRCVRGGVDSRGQRHGTRQHQAPRRTPRRGEAGGARRPVHGAAPATTLVRGTAGALSVAKPEHGGRAV